MNLEQPIENMLQAAKAYASLGWHVFPVNQHKKPRTTNGFHDATTDFDQIEEWWTATPGVGIGIATGATSGIWVLDIDVKDGAPGVETLNEMVAANQPLPETVTAVSGSGGLHYYFDYNAEQPVSNGSNSNIRASYGAGIDVRGDGGYIVAAPSPHVSGKTYHWAQGRSPHTGIGVQPAAGPGWLYQIMTEEAAPTNGVVIPMPTRSHDNKPDHIGWWKQQQNFGQMLEADGWTLHSSKGNGQTWWTRPGKNRRDGHSAVLHNDGEGPLVIFTTDIPGFLGSAGTRTADGSGVTVDLFTWAAQKWHGGDRSAAAREARSAYDTAHQHQPAATTAEVELPVDDAHRPPGFVDLSEWWDNPQPRKTADLLKRSDGHGLAYVDQLNWIHGDSGSGKTWVALHALTQLLDDGVNVAWIHYEDPTPATVVSRLKLLGVTRDQLDLVHYYDPKGDPLHSTHIIELCQAADVEHCFLDSIGEALNASGVNEDQDSEVGPWITQGPRAIVNAGIGFTGIDHGTKDGKNKLYPSGSKRKRAALTGAGILVEAITSPTVLSDGDLRLTCAKDRHGNNQHGQVIGLARLRHNRTAGSIRFLVDVPGGEGRLDQAAENRARLVRAAVRAVEDEPGILKNQVVSLMPAAQKKRKFEAINEAIEAGQIVVDKADRRAERLFVAGFEGGALVDDLV